ncbi:hypothetical protein [Streptomyces syringium]|uniref:hypothetical protein n=1 Tax=Streptomyces syringium TaxID=76729 RepID=UPI003AAC905C
MPVEVVFFNVGQGDCTLLWFYDRKNKNVGTHAVLIDCGSTEPLRPLNPLVGTQTFSAKDQMVARIKAKLDKYLQRLRNPYVLDCLIVTHPDEDHFNLLEHVLLSELDPPQLKYTIRQVLYGLHPLDYRERGGDFLWTLFHHWNQLGGPSGQRIENPPRQVTMPSSPAPLLQGTGLLGANVYMLGGVLGPEGPNDVAKYETGPKEAIANASSLVTMIRGEPDALQNRQKVLLMADAVTLNERYLVGTADSWCRRENNLWLKIGHHGSVTSTGNAWLDHTTPDGLFVSTGPKAFGGRTATCTQSNVTQRLVPHWRGVRPQLTVPHPRIKTPPNWGYVVQDDSRGTRGPFVHLPATDPNTHVTDPLFSSMAVPNTNGTATGWRGVDWHLLLDDAAPGSFEIWFE